jgi:hypothetical protein
MCILQKNTFIIDEAYFRSHSFEINHICNFHVLTYRWPKKTHKQMTEQQMQKLKI